LRDDGIVPVICPTCQMSWRVKHPCQRSPATLHGVVFDILVGSAARPAFAATVRLRFRFAQATPDTTLHPSAPRGCATPSPKERAKRGGPGRTRTCNQTVMSGRISISFVDFAAFLFDFDRVRCVLMRLFLARNWCGVILRHWRTNPRRPLTLNKCGVLFGSDPDYLAAAAAVSPGGTIRNMKVETFSPGLNGPGV
jgi:hypothetical protein